MSSQFERYIMSTQANFLAILNVDFPLSMIINALPSMSCFAFTLYCFIHFNVSTSAHHMNKIPM